MDYRNLCFLMWTMKLMIQINATQYEVRQQNSNVEESLVCWGEPCKCHDMIYSDCEWKSFLSLTNKHDFSSELFSNLLICQQHPKQLETWDGSLTTKGLTKKLELLKSKCVILSRIYSFFQQKTYKKITSGPEKLLTLQKPFRTLKKNSEYES